MRRVKIFSVSIALLGISTLLAVDAAAACITSAETCTVEVSKIALKAYTGATKCARRETLGGDDRVACATGADPATPLSKCVAAFGKITPKQLGFCGANAAAAIGAAAATCNSAIDSAFADYDLYN